jgi:CheY-like chemotaxis protein
MDPMTVDEVTRLLDAIGRLLGVLVWPAVLVFVAVRFRRPIGDFFGHLGEFSVKAPGLEASARRQVEAAAALGAALATQPGSDGAAMPAQVADVVAAAIPDSRSQRRLQQRIVLWVDDKPDNNRYERKAMEALGIRFALSTSTEDALDQVRQQAFDLIISDMSRPPDSRAGYTLLDALRVMGDRTPYVIYSGSRAPDQVAEARQHGALGSTDDPQELIRVVTRTLGSLPAR